MRSPSARPDSSRAPSSPLQLVTTDGTDQPINADEDDAQIKSHDFRLQLPMGSDRESQPGSIVMQMAYHGDNSSQQAWFTATPLGGSGTERTDNTGDMTAKGNPLCVQAYNCRDFSRYDVQPISGVGCGYDLTGTSHHDAWNETYSTSTSTLITPVRYAVQTEMGTASASGEDCPLATASTCTDGGTGQTGDGGVAITGSDYDRRSTLRPLFDCTSSGSTVHQICITYITGYYYPDTDTYEITDTWMECWLEYDDAAAMDRVGDGGLWLLPNASLVPGDGATRLDAASPAAVGARIPITLVGTGAIPGGEPTRIVRRRQGAVRDAILVDLGKATDADLASAIGGYLALRSEQGDTASKDVEGVVTISSLGRDWQSRERPGIHAQLEALRSAPERSIPGIGHGRTLTVTAPMPRVSRQPTSQ